MRTRISVKLLFGLLCVLAVCCTVEAHRRKKSSRHGKTSKAELTLQRFKREILSVQNRIHYVQAKNDKLSKKISCGNTEYTEKSRQLKSKLSYLRKQYSNVSEKFETCNKDSIDACALKAKIASLEFKSNMVCSEVSVLQSKLDECKGKSLLFTGEIANLNGENEDLNTQGNNLQADLNACTTSNDEMLQQIPRLHMKSIDLQNEVTDLRAQLVDLELELENCRPEDEQELRATVERLRVENQRLQEQLAALRDRIVVINDQLSKCEATEKKLREELEPVQDCPDQLQYLENTCKKSAANLTLEKINGKHYFFAHRFDLLRCVKLHDGKFEYSQIKLFLPELAGSKNWFGAGDFCRKFGLQLASVETAEEDAALRGRILEDLGDETGVEKTFFWHGLNDLDASSVYTFSGTGRPASHLGWLEGQPQTLAGRSCAGFNRPDGETFGWQLEDCSTKFAFFVCELEGVCNSALGAD